MDHLESDSGTSVADRAAPENTHVAPEDVEVLLSRPAVRRAQPQFYEEGEPEEAGAIDNASRAASSSPERSPDPEGPVVAGSGE